jgi:hypothetical protein
MYMKKLFMWFVLISMVVTLAAGQTGLERVASANEATGSEDTEEIEELELVLTAEPDRLLAQQKELAKQMIRQKAQEMQQEMALLKPQVQNILQNQNQVRLAVHSLLAMEDLVGGIGPQVSEIARSFNNSVQASINAEERIQKKSGFARLFTGGDEKAAEEIEGLVTQNQNRIQELSQLREQCECDEEVKQMLQEQLQNMENEQARLRLLALAEQKSKGIFGWLWK